MGKIFCLMGKSSSGLRRLVPYTTRPIRAGEREGVEYHFVTEQKLQKLQAAGKVVELRAYETVHGIWKYFTVCEDDMGLERNSYAVIGTLESWRAMCGYFGREIMRPVYIEVEDGLRLERALARERSQRTPDYKEMCRRFLADTEDFSEENLKTEGIARRFQNADFDFCFQEIKLFIQKEIQV